MFAIRGKMTTWSAVAQIQPICFVTSAIFANDAHPSTQISVNADLPLSTNTHPLFRNEWIELKTEEDLTRVNMIPVIRIYLLYLQTVLIKAEPGVTIKNAGKQHVHNKRHILSFKSKYMET